MANKIATVTGGSRGLGRNTAVNLARRGVDVLFTYRVNQKEAESLVREVESLGRKAAGFRLDTGNTRLFEGFVTEVSKTLQSWGCDRFDYLVNSAGNSLNAGLEETTESQFDEIFKVHVKGVYFLTQRLLPLMNNGGRIVNISGAVTRINLPGSSAYGAAKGAVEVLTRYMTKEFGPRDITANVVAPGGIETDFSGGILRDNPEVNKAHRSDHRFRTYGCAGRYVIATAIFDKVAPPPAESNYPHGRRIYELFKTSLENPISPYVVGEKIREILESDTWKLRHPVGPDAEGFLAWRASMSDEQWVEWGALSDKQWVEYVRQNFHLNVSL